jgi:hypothetical protein
MGMDIPTLIPTILKIMIAVIATVTIILMGLLVIKIYRDEPHHEDQEPK